MSQCDALVANASDGVAAALRAVDCLSGETTGSAFSRLFGAGGALMPALTLLLTLYIAFFAFSLLTGRSRIGISALTPRMLTLGLVLTFATSWVAYQSVVWNLATGAPDQIAGILLGARGSATQLFADRIDLLFAAISETAGSAAQGAPQQAGQGSFTPGNLMWLGALLLMLGTVGILVTARIALAVLLALGPIFVTMLIFGGTRGLFAGWLRGVVLTALTPLFAVLGGSFMIELAVPIVAGLRGAEGIDGRAAMALFVMAAVHCALMALALRVASTMVAGWSIFGLSGSQAEPSVNGAMPAAARLAQSPPQQAPPTAPAQRSRSMASPALYANAFLEPASATRPSDVAPRPQRATFIAPGHPGVSLRPVTTPRARGVGSRFASRTPASKDIVK